VLNSPQCHNYYKLTCKLGAIDQRHLLSQLHCFIWNLSTIVVIYGAHMWCNSGFSTCNKNHRNSELIKNMIKKLNKLDEYFFNILVIYPHLCTAAQLSSCGHLLQNCPLLIGSGRSPNGQERLAKADAASHFSELDFMKWANSFLNWIKPGPENSNIYIMFHFEGEQQDDGRTK